MKISFSTLACPLWTMPQIVKMAADAGYDGIEVRFVEGEDSLWKLAAFSGAGLNETKRALADSGLKISCVDTSCRFHWPDAAERGRWIEEGVRMAALAVELESPGIRVFGDTIQPGADRKSTRMWVAEGIRELAGRIGGVGVWLESHGDFSSATETAGILDETGGKNTGVVWDPVNSFAENGETPENQARVLGERVRHVHVKDMRRAGDAWRHVLTGEGEFPLDGLKRGLLELRYDGFVSFEWEKKWHPEIEDATIALPHFVKWFRESWAHG
ncbi:MAG: sugar phosphate isomerase/epimerase family protein [Candidatus Sulfotelmatobacter sp.]